MRSYKKCNVCGEYHWTNERCPSEFTVYHDDYLEEEGKRVRADSFEDAAEKYAVYYNQDDYPLLDGEEIEIEVESPEGEKRRFKCGAETTVYYSINELNKER